MEPTTSYSPTTGSTLRAERENAGVSQDEVAAEFDPPTTRQRLGRWERNAQVPYVQAMRYRAALDAAVAAKRPEAIAS